MKTSLKKGTGAFYDIELTLEVKDQDGAKAGVLKDFQKDLQLPGFRKGFVPMHLVEEHIKPEYMTMGIFENLVNTGLQTLLKANPTLRFIGEPYEIKQDKKGEEVLVTLKLDIFPEVEVKGDGWKELSMTHIEAEATKEEIEDALMKLKKNYADYIDTDIVTYDSISKLEMHFLDKDGEELEKGTLYLGQQEFDEFSFFKDHFIGKKKGEDIIVKYDEKSFPPTVQSKKAGSSAAKVDFKLLDIKSIVLPEITPENLLKFFGKDSEVKTEAELLTYIKDSIGQQKADTELMQKVEDFLKVIREKHMDVSVPKTLLDQELGARLQNLEKKFGGREKMEQYLTQMGEDKAKKFFDDIRVAAQESLEKFFILQKVCDLLELAVNREHPTDLEVERKLYDKLVSGEAHHHTAAKKVTKKAK
ncbi:MAG: trigger factor [Candidatus Absconditabacteria bacterium]